MKKQILTFSLVLMTLCVFSQAKFYTENGTKVVTEFKPGMSDIKVVLPLPETVFNHEFVQFLIDYQIPDNSRDQQFHYLTEYKSSVLSGKKVIELWIKKAGQEENDFVYESWNGTYYFDVEQPLKPNLNTNRNFTTGEIIIRISGKDLDKYEWKDGKQVPVYKFKNLGKHSIKMNYGELAKTATSQDGRFTVNRFEDDTYYPSVVINDSGLEIKYVTKMDDSFAEKSDALWFHVKSIEEGESNIEEFDMSGGGGGGSSAPALSVNELKRSVAIQFLHASHTESWRQIKMPDVGMYWPRSENDDLHFYEPFSGKKGKFDKVLATEGAKLPWKKGTIGNFACEILEVPVYMGDQTVDNGEFRTVKSGEEGKSKQLLLFVGENDGDFIAGSLYKAGSKPLTAKEEKIWNHLKSSLKVK